MTIACRAPTEALDAKDPLEITAVVLTDFLRRNPPTQWPIVYVSDEYVDFTMDSFFIALMPTYPVPVQIARRADVWVSYDIVRDGGLLLEPGRPEITDDGSVVQALRFSSTSDFGGEFEYRLKRRFDRWVIEGTRVIWLT